MLPDLLDGGLDLLAMLESRTMRRIVLIVGAVLIGLDLGIVAGGRWPNVGADPARPGCRYWTGLGFVRRGDLDPQHCPASTTRADAAGRTRGGPPSADGATPDRAR